MEIASRSVGRGWLKEEETEAERSLAAWTRHVAYCFDLSFTGLPYKRPLHQHNTRQV